MRTETLTFDGIKRVTSPQNPGNGACDDLQNMRYEYGALRAVHGFNKVLEGGSENIIKAFIHRIGDTENLIIVTRDSAAGTCSVSLVTDSGTDEIKSFADGDRNSIEVTSINNILIIKCDEFNSVGGGRIYSYLWKDGEYNEWYSGRLPENPPYSSESDTVEKMGDSMVIPAGEVSPLRIYEYASSLHNRLCHNESETKSEGYVLVCVNFTLFDGSETKPSSPKMIRLGGTFQKGSGDAPAGTPYDWEDDVVGSFRIFLMLVGEYNNSDDMYMKMEVGVQNAKITLDKTYLTESFYNKYKDLIKSINIYSTYPVSAYDLMKTITEDQRSVIETIGGGKIALFDLYDDDSTFANTNYKAVKPMTKNDVIKATDGLFYKQKSIPLTDNPGEMSKAVELKFNESLMSNERMKVDSSGYMQYCGKIISYNNRLHIYGISSIITSTNLNWGWTGITPQVTVSMLVYIRETSGDVTTFHSFNTAYLDGCLMIHQFVSYPDSRAYRAEMFFTTSDGSKRKAEIKLSPSSAYNYAYRYGDQLVATTAYTGSIPTSASAHPEYSSPGQMIVSAQSNPAYFAPENTYSFQGAITAVTPLTDAVSEAQFGQFPLAVFTTEGIWTLEQGSGEVLYSRSVKISDISCATGNVIQTKTGVYFTAEGSVWRLSGRKIEKISEIAEGEPDAYLEQNAEFAALCRSSKCVSVPVKKSMIDVVSAGYPLAYDQFNDELYVGYSDSSVEFSFVYGVRTGLWRSDTRRIIHQSGPVAVLSSYGEWQDRYGDVVRTDSENASDTSFVAVMMKTRPFSLGSYGYKSIHRMISRCLLDAGSYNTSTSPGSLGDNIGKGLAGIYLFASDDLMEWRLVGGDQYEGMTHRMQIMKVSGSYRYYTLVIAGYMKAGGSVSATEIMIDDRYAGKIR